MQQPSFCSRAVVLSERSARRYRMPACVPREPNGGTEGDAMSSMKAPTKFEKCKVNGRQAIVGR